MRMQLDEGKMLREITYTSFQQVRATGIQRHTLGNNLGKQKMLHLATQRGHVLTILATRRLFTRISSVFPTNVQRVAANLLLEVWSLFAIAD